MELCPLASATMHTELFLYFHNFSLGMSLLTLLFLHLLTFFTPENMFIDFKERGSECGGERTRERDIDVRNINQLPLVCALTGDQTRSLGTCFDWGSNLQPFGVMLQPTEPSGQAL